MVGFRVVPAEAVKVVQIGDPVLRRVADPVEEFDAPGFREEAERLEATLEAFRREQGFGRAIAAPQIGVSRRFIALNLGCGPFVIVNPEIVRRSDETFTMWDDCMSFPWLLVRVRRHSRISVRYRDLDGKTREWPNLDRAASELLQHEIDHLDGILALDRALDRDSIVSREVFEADRETFRKRVDYCIGD